MQMIEANAKFSPGRIAISRTVMAALPPEVVVLALARHLEGDWGDVDEHDWKRNEAALEHGFRLFSRYESKSGTTFWIITEADRSCTTILLPSDN